MFASIRKSAIITFIGTVVLFAVVAILAVWQVFDNDVLSRSVASLVTIGTSLILLIAAINFRLSGNILNREKPLSVGGVILYTILAFILVSFVMGFLSEFI